MARASKVAARQADAMERIEAKLDQLLEALGKVAAPAESKALPISQDEAAQAEAAPAEEKRRK